MEDNNDISDIINKFSDILKEKDINLNEYIDENITKNNDSSSNSTKNNSSSNIDINTILKFKQIADKLNSSNNPRSSLLQSLKPFLSTEKQNKLEEYIKISNILSILDIFKNNSELF